MARGARTNGVQVCTGLGAGNLGDELMAAAFWNHIAADVRLRVEAFEDYRNLGFTYPTRHDYQGASCEADLARAGVPGYAVGSTPVTELWGLGWPLQAITRRLRGFQQRSLPYHMVGIGVDAIEGEEARALFAEVLLDATSWTVRTESCRDALLDLGVAGERIQTGADWAWLYEPSHDHRDWAAAEWKSLGIDARRPLVVVNVVNEIWAHRDDVKRQIAGALDHLAREGLQVAFFCNEVRPGAYYDHAAALATQGFMAERSTIVAPGIHPLDRVLGLLSHATVTLSQRYHFTVESVLAGTVPVSIARGDKLSGLLAELGLPAAGTMDEQDGARLARQTLDTLDSRHATLAMLENRRAALRERAHLNLAFVPELRRAGSDR